MTEETGLPPNKLAFLDSNNEVIDVLHTVDRFTALLLSNPIYKDITGTNGAPLAELGWKYDPTSKALIDPNTPVDGLPE